MTFKRYILTYNSVCEQTVRKARLKERAKRVSELKISDEMMLRGRLGRTLSKSLLDGKKTQLSELDVRWINRRSRVMRIRLYGENRVIHQYQFLVTTKVQFEGSKKMLSEVESYLVMAKTSTLAMRRLKSHLGDFYPFEFFNTDWKLVKIRVLKIEMANTFVGVAKGDDWIFDQ